MKNEIINTVFELKGIDDTRAARLRAEALINEILAYLNRDDITEEMFPVLCTVIADSLDDFDLSKVQSLTEGDMSISFLQKSPFFGRLDAFKVIRGVV